MPQFAYTRVISPTRIWHWCDICGAKIKPGGKVLCTWKKTPAAKQPHWTYICIDCIAATPKPEAKAS